MSSIVARMKASVFINLNSLTLASSCFYLAQNAVLFLSQCFEWVGVIGIIEVQICEDLCLIHPGK